MKTKDKQDEAQRHAQRNYVIKEVRNQLVTYQGCTFTEADIQSDEFGVSEIEKSEKSLVPNHFRQ